MTAGDHAISPDKHERRAIRYGSLPRYFTGESPGRTSTATAKNRRRRAMPGRPHSSLRSLMDAWWGQHGFHGFHGFHGLFERCTRARKLQIPGGTQTSPESSDGRVAARRKPWNAMETMFWHLSHPWLYSVCT